MKLVKYQAFTVDRSCRVPRQGVRACLRAAIGHRCIYEEPAQTRQPAAPSKRRPIPSLGTLLPTCHMRYICFAMGLDMSRIDRNTCLESALRFIDRAT